jgi:tetratricopeptide (TPR) repeat protein
MTSHLDHTRQSIETDGPRDRETTSPDHVVSERPQVLEPGTRVGPYVIGSTLGAGAMGVVYAAYDPRLDRQVAIKMVRADPGEQSKGAPRLLREAQALAQLSHPNVVPVFDVGELGDGVFLAMELVDGKDLRHWLDTAPHDAPRSWREIIGLFVQAGRGLAAAHAAGIVHRDFKPDNVMLDSHGRARVTDFGLARGQGEEDESIGPIEPTASLSATLTRTGSVVGTPSYMSPEQHIGRPVDARADQYAFCVSLYEALYRERPFVGRDLQDLANQKWAESFYSDVAQQLRRGVPPGVHAAIVRGLKRRVELRFESMTALLDALEQASAPPVRSKLLLPALAALTLVGGGVAIASLDRPRCPEARDQLTGVWDDVRADRVAQAFDAAKTAAADTWPQVRSRLDDYAVAWVEAHAQLCATAIDREAGPELDAGMLCLRQRLARLGEVAAVLEEGTKTAVHSADALVDSLEPPIECRDAIANAERPDVVRTRAGLRERLDAANVRQDAGQYGVSRQLAMEIAGEAEAAGLEDIVLEARLLIAISDARMGRHEDAEAGYTSVYWHASAAQLDGLAFDAASRLVFLLSSLVERPREGEQWRRHADALLERLGDGDTLRRAKLLENASSLYDDEGEGERAEALLRTALAIRLSLQPATHASVATARNNLALRLVRRGALDEALAMHRLNYRNRVAHLGPMHPDVAQSLANEARVLIDMDRAKEALARLDEALPIVHATLGASHPTADALYVMRGAALLQLEEEAAARPWFILAIATGTLRYGANSIIVGQRWNALGVSHLQAREWTPSRELFDRAMAIFADHGEQGELSLAGTASNAAMAELADGNLARALVLADRAHAGFALRREQGYRDASIALTHRAHVLLAHGDTSRARADVEAASLLPVPGPTGTARAAAVELLEARLDLLERGPNPTRIATLRDALARLQRLDPRAVEVVIGERWIAELEARSAGERTASRPWTRPR